MKVHYYTNACCVYESNGFKLIADPWLTDGGFEGSWYHPKNAVKPTDEELQKVDALFISHLHPDHYDPETLKKFPKNITVVALDKAPNFLLRKMKNLGFTNFVHLKDKQAAKVGPFNITMYAPFTKHPFDESVLGNLIDSAIVVEDETDTVLNANDNTPDEAAAKMLRAHHGEFTELQLKYSLAGPYPSCFLNLTDKMKQEEKFRLLNRLKTKMDKVAEILGGKVVPFAGNYCLAGSLAYKNKWLAVEDLDMTQVPEGKPYSYEKKECPSDSLLVSDLIFARSNLWKKQCEYRFFPNYQIRIELPSGIPFDFNFNHSVPELNKEPDLVCLMDPRLLQQILTRESHWNNAEVGCHIDFIRKGPYNPDIQTMMSFFHA